MALYYFDTWDGDKVVSDNEGVECADNQAACGAAAKALLELARDVVNGTTSCELSVEVKRRSKEARLSSNSAI
jgi:hypothetical protein